MQMSHRISGFQCSPIRRLVPYARDAKKNGVHVYHLNIGQPDIKTPSEALAALADFPDDIIAYGSSEGRDDLRQAWADYYNRFGVDITADDILITTGGSEAIQFAFMTLCDPGDEIIIPEPYYTNVASFANIAMVTLVPVTSTMETCFVLPDINEFENKITSRTRGVLLCSPNNPTGHVYSPEELIALLEMCRRHDIFLIVDEVYREFCYDGMTFTSVLAYPEYADRVICIDSFSKRFSMCGARIGALISRNGEVKESALKLSQARLCPPEVEQFIACAAFRAPATYLEDVKKEYEKRRDFFVDRLKKIPDIRVSEPLGAFYLVVEFPVDDAEKFAIFMLQEFSLNGRTTMFAPAEDFYVTKGIGRKQARLAYVLNTDDLAAAADCLEAGLAAYRKKYLA